jgi:hypothetical protein
LGFLDLGTLILSLSQQLKELGWAFLFFFEILFRILEIFNAFYIAIIFIIVQWMPERAAIKHTFIRYWQFQGLNPVPNAQVCVCI